MDHLVHKKLGGPSGNKALGAVHGLGCNLNRVGSGSWNMPRGRRKEEGSAGYQTQGKARMDLWRMNRGNGHWLRDDFCCGTMRTR